MNKELSPDFNGLYLEPVGTFPWIPGGSCFAG